MLLNLSQRTSLKNTKCDFIDYLLLLLSSLLLLSLLHDCTIKLESLRALKTFNYSVIVRSKLCHSNC